MPDDYRLEPVEIDRIFAKSVVPDLFDTAAGDDEPLLILVGGQPGSGKTQAGAEAVEKSGRAVVSIIGDDLRLHHPQYRHLLETDLPGMPEATAQLSGQLVQRAIDYAIAHRFNVLVEGTFRDPNVPLTTAQKFKDAGFHVEAHVLAVPPELSRISIAERYTRDLRLYGVGRFTSSEAHDKAVVGVLETLAAFEDASAPVDRIVVRTRDEEPLFDAEREPGAAIEGACSAVDTEWRRVLTDEELTEAGPATDYLVQHHAEDAGVEPLVRRINAYRHRIFELRSGEAVYVRPHKRGGVPVGAYVRRHAGS